MLAEGRASRRAMSSSEAGESLGAACGDQLRLHAGELDGLVTVIGDRHKNGDETEFAVLNRKYLRLVRQIVGIDGDRDSFRGMLVVGRICLRRLRLRHDEFLRRR